MKEPVTRAILSSRLINGGVHVPTLSSQYSPRVIDWLLAHPKP